MEPDQTDSDFPTLSRPASPWRATPEEMLWVEDYLGHIDLEADRKSIEDMDDDNTIVDNGAPLPTMAGVIAMHQARREELLEAQRQARALEAASSAAADTTTGSVQADTEPSIKEWQPIEDDGIVLVKQYVFEYVPSTVDQQTSKAGGIVIDFIGAVGISMAADKKAYIQYCVHFRGLSINEDKWWEASHFADLNGLLENIGTTLTAVHDVGSARATELGLVCVDGASSGLGEKRVPAVEEEEIVKRMKMEDA